MADGTYTTSGVQTVHIDKNGSYTPTDPFDNKGHVEFDVDFGTDYNYCEIKLQVKLSKKLTEDGGTIKIDK